MKFNSSMLRERFTIQTPGSPDDGGAPRNIIATGTRMPVSLQSANLPEENFVIRAHNMHSCVRFVGKILHDYDKKGPILNRSPALHWQELWEDCLGHYERVYVPNPWVVVYHKGHPIFETGEHHPFLDVIEKCDIVNKRDYDSSIKLAQNALKQTSADAVITYDSAMALVANLERSVSRCGMVIRNPNRTNNFNLTINETATSGKMNIALGLSISAAFLEGVQLGFFIGLQQAKLRKRIFERFSLQDKNTREARERLVQLEAEINAMENRYTVRYRPERPNFLETIEISQRLALQNKALGESGEPLDRL
jgi:hypothetical protein